MFKKKKKKGHICVLHHRLKETMKILVFRTFKLLNLTCGERAAAITALLIDIWAPFVRHVIVCAAQQDVRVFSFMFLLPLTVDFGATPSLKRQLKR